MKKDCEDVFFFKQKTAYEIRLSLVGSEMCIRDSIYTPGRKKKKIWDKKAVRVLEPTYYFLYEPNGTPLIHFITFYLGCGYDVVIMYTYITNP